MTGEEVHSIAEIRQCLARCTQAGDARKADAYAACFTRDGVLELHHETISGHVAIRDWMAGPSVIPSASGHAAGFVSHHLTTCQVDFTAANEATVRTYWLVTSATGLDHNGFYVDRFVRQDDEWLIAHRRPRTLWISPASVLHGAR